MSVRPEVKFLFLDEDKVLLKILKNYSKPLENSWLKKIKTINCKS
jgi:hypothetical protein